MRTVSTATTAHLVWFGGAFYLVQPRRGIAGAAAQVLPLRQKGNRRG